MIEHAVRSSMVALVVPPSFTDEHGLLRQTVRQFVQSRVEPQATDHDQSATFNTDLLAELGALGLPGVTHPEADGGAGTGGPASVNGPGEVGSSDPGFTLGFLAHSLLFVNNFYWAS